MERIYDNCCGIDVHKKLIVACLRKGNKQEIREFGATTRELLKLADWLKESDCEMVAMESTASYWKPLYNILESSDLNAMVVNAHHMKAVPGRKTDVKDALLHNTVVQNHNYYHKRLATQFYYMYYSLLLFILHESCILIKFFFQSFIKFIFCNFPIKFLGAENSIF